MVQSNAQDMQAGLRNVSVSKEEILKSRVYLPVIGCLLSFLALTMPPLILPRRYLSGVCTHNRHISPSDGVNRQPQIH